jgi:Uncharacterized protein conserved in bacteria
MTTSNYSAAQLHVLGISEVARITQEMQAILDAQGIKQGTIAARVKQLQDDPQYHMPNTSVGRAQFGTLPAAPERSECAYAGVFPGDPKGDAGGRAHA